MHIHLATALAIALLVVLPATARAQDAITVDITAVVADVARKPIGVNVNFLFDHDSNRAAALDTLAGALKKMGVKYLRYPGGEKSDAYLWSVPPYTSAVPTLARWAAGEYPQNQEWPSYDRHLVEADGHTFKAAPLDFDEFMAVCREIDCVPTVVICYDSMYKPAQAGGVAPTRAQLLETAREWVRYANVTRKYGVTHWEIGNESYLSHYNGSASASNYARDLIEFSRVMKAVDPTILVGANGESDSWWRTVLSSASGAIDFLAVHNYPATDWGSYAYYRNNQVNLMGAVQVAERAIEAYAAESDRTRLFIATTEMNSADWGGGWPHVNDMGHALVAFDIFGAHLANPKVAFTQMWNTRWSGNNTSTTPALWDALNKHNEVQATGRAAAIWGQFLKETLVASSSTAMVRSYATYSPARGTLTVFLINKDTVARESSVSINTPDAHSAVDTWTFSGTGAKDVSPAWVHQGQRPQTGNLMAVTLPPVSVTVLDIAPNGVVHLVPGTIQAEDFADGAYWDATRGNAGLSYRATDVDIQPTSDSGGGFNIGWMSAGEWLEYVVRVNAGGYYDLLARVASPHNGTAIRVSVNGSPVTGDVAVPHTGGWQNWKTVSQPTQVYLAAGLHRVKVAAVTGGFNLNWLALNASSISAHGVPGRIESEDFDEGAYWDSTPGNLGTAGRDTDVDVQPTTDLGGGFNIGWHAPGEWQEYTIRVEAAGYYDFAARVASPHTGRAFHVTLNGADVTGAVVVPNTGGYQRWATTVRDRVFLPAGTHRLRTVAQTSGYNVNWISLTPSQ